MAHAARLTSHLTDVKSLCFGQERNGASSLLGQFFNRSKHWYAVARQIQMLSLLDGTLPTLIIQCRAIFNLSCRRWIARTRNGKRKLVLIVECCVLATQVTSGWRPTGRCLYDSHPCTQDALNYRRDIDCVILADQPPYAKDARILNDHHVVYHVFRHRSSHSKYTSAGSTNIAIHWIFWRTILIMLHIVN